MAIDLNTLKLVTFFSFSSQGPPWAKSKHSPRCHLVRGKASRAPGDSCQVCWMWLAHSQAGTRKHDLDILCFFSLLCFHCVCTRNKAFPSPICCWETQYWLILNSFQDFKNELFIKHKGTKKEAKAEQFMAIQLLSYLHFAKWLSWLFRLCPSVHLLIHLSVCPSIRTCIS